jgi:ABC-type antimicrobial peptide transport system permease subunit
MTLVFAGVVIGLVMALALGRSLESLLFGVRPADPLTLAGVSVFLLFVAFAACALPALRASRVDPIHALRNE